MKCLRYSENLSRSINCINRVFRITTKSILFATNIFSLILLHLSPLAWDIAPYEYIMPAYLGLGFIVLVAINVCFLLLWIIFHRWRPILVNIIALALCWNPMSIYFPTHLKEKVVPENCIKIMTYNVMGFNWDMDEDARNNPIFEYMKSSGADIICMQEFVINNQHYNPKGIISISEIDRILSHYPYRSIVRFGNAEEVYSFGIACYSKFPIQNTTELPIESELNGAAVFDVRINEQIVKLFNVHLESNKLTLEDKQLYSDFIGNHDSDSFDQVSQNIQQKLGSAYIQRAKQADLIAEWIDKEKDYPTIVCGDFNDTPISYVYKKVRGDLLSDSFAETGMGQGISYNRNMFWFRIDYIMHSKDIRAHNASIDRVKFSDHYPLSTYLQLGE